MTPEELIALNGGLKIVRVVERREEAKREPKRVSFGVAPRDESRRDELIALLESYDRQKWRGDLRRRLDAFPVVLSIFIGDELVEKGQRVRRRGSESDGWMMRIPSLLGWTERLPDLSVPKKIASLLGLICGAMVLRAALGLWPFMAFMLGAVIIEGVGDRQRHRDRERARLLGALSLRRVPPPDGNLMPRGSKILRR